MARRVAQDTDCVMLNLFQHPPVIRAIGACGAVDAETSSG
jgi:hypothetical protein